MKESSEQIRRARDKWRFRGDSRPDFAMEPKPGQESVWSYPRPPRLERDPRRVAVIVEGTTVAETRQAFRVLETASPPAFYLPPQDIRMDYIEPSPGSSICEWKGAAVYWSLRVDAGLVSNAGWSYPEPFEGFEAMADYISFFPAKVECRVAGELVAPQPGGFYGGWVTREIVGPFKGLPGTEWW